MNILVTGAAGFIGSHLAQRLRTLGHEVHGIDNFDGYYDRTLKDDNAAELRACGVTITEADLAGAQLDDLLQGVEIVYHLAGQPGISENVPFKSYLRNNVIATQRLAQACQASNTLQCFVNISTSSVYGVHATSTEDSETKPTSHYGTTKLAAEQIILSMQRSSGFPACSLRIFSVYGPRERPDKLYPRVIASILGTSEFPLYEGSLEHSRSFTYIDDVVDAFVLILNKVDVSLGEIFNIGSETEITTRRGIEIVEEITGRKARFKSMPPRDGDQLRTLANIEKAKRLLGYSPSTIPEEGLAEQIRWYRDKLQ